MKNLIIFFLCIFSFTQTWASDAKSLTCTEGKYRLAADLVKQKINIFEMDPFTKSEFDLFGFDHTITSNNLYLIRTQKPYYVLNLKIKNDGLIKGKFHLNMDADKQTRIGMAVYEGWFSWEPITFNHCILQH
jgi:hypothetical protein